MDLGINLGNGLLNMKYKILQPKDMKITLNETILTHFFNYVIQCRKNKQLQFRQDVMEYYRCHATRPDVFKPDYYSSEEDLFQLSHSEMENWKVQLIEDLLKGTIDFKNDDDNN